MADCDKLPYTPRAIDWGTNGRYAKPLIRVGGVVDEMPANFRIPASNIPPLGLRIDPPPENVTVPGIVLTSFMGDSECSQQSSVFLPLGGGSGNLCQQLQQLPPGTPVEGDSIVVFNPNDGCRQVVLEEVGGNSEWPVTEPLITSTVCSIDSSDSIVAIDNGNVSKLPIPALRQFINENGVVTFTGHDWSLPGPWVLNYPIDATEVCNKPPKFITISFSGNPHPMGSASIKLNSTYPALPVYNSTTGELLAKTELTPNAAYDFTLGKDPTGTADAWWCSAKPKEITTLTPDFCSLPTSLYGEDGLGNKQKLPIAMLENYANQRTGIYTDLTLTGTDYGLATPSPVCALPLTNFFGRVIANSPAGATITVGSLGTLPIYNTTTGAAIAANELLAGGAYHFTLGHVPGAPAQLAWWADGAVNIPPSFTLPDIPSLSPFLAVGFAGGHTVDIRTGQIDIWAENSGTPPGTERLFALSAPAAVNGIRARVNNALFLENNSRIGVYISGSSQFQHVSVTRPSSPTYSLPRAFVHIVSSSYAVSSPSGSIANGALTSQYFLEVKIVSGNIIFSVGSHPNHMIAIDTKALSSIGTFQNFGICLTRNGGTGKLSGIFDRLEVF